MRALSYTENPYLEAFREFYYEVLKQRAHALKMSHISVPGEGKEPGPESLCREIQEKLVQCLESQALDSARQIGDQVALHYREAHYIMVALADEIFLRMEWVGRRIWEDHLLEARFFQTHTAGETFFERLDSLLHERDPLKADLAILYLFALGLGFQGKYRQGQPIENLAAYRTQLYAFIHHRPSDLLASARRYLQTDPYIHNLVSENKHKIPDIKLWGWIFTGFCVSYLFLSFVLWHHAVNQVDRVIADIIVQAQEQGRL